SKRRRRNGRQHAASDSTSGQWPRGRHPLWRRRDVLCDKATQVVNFAQGELLLIGAWVCWLTKNQLPFWLGMPIALVFMFALGVVVQVVVLRPMIGEPIISVIMVTIALSTIFQAATKWIFGVNLQPFPSDDAGRNLPHENCQCDRRATE